MTSNTSSDQSEILEELLYELLLYKKKDIIAIQEKLGINGNIDQTALNQSKKGKTLEDSFGLLSDLVGELRQIQDFVEATFRKMTPEETDHLLLYLEENISMIQSVLGVDNYTNRETSGLEAIKNAIAYLYMFRFPPRKWLKCNNTEIHRSRK